MQKSEQKSGNLSVGSDFSNYLRTGRRYRPVELKFNPYHDPRNGQFTFAPGGRAARNNGDSNSRRATSASRSFQANDARNAGNYSVHTARAGDTLEKIAKRRKGVTVADLKWLNDLDTDTLRVGQPIKLPHQTFLDAGREAKNKVLALDYYIQTHSGRLPPDVAHPPSLAEQFADPTNWHPVEKNGYRFYLDPTELMRQVSGTVTSNPSQGRSRAAQLSAGGADRLPGDHGGHYIARRFNGPTDAFNHFAQDGNFNRGLYRSLEDRLDKERKAGKKVDVRITPTYEGLSRRPSSIQVVFRVDGHRYIEEFSNRSGRK